MGRNLRFANIKNNFAAAGFTMLIAAMPAQAAIVSVEVGDVFSYGHFIPTIWRAVAV